MKWHAFFAVSVALAGISPAHAAAPSHCLTLFGACKYPKNFTHFDYVNPDAPKGGTFKQAEIGNFDSLNPFLLKGVKAPAASSVFESLMAPSLDEPQTYYGLLAESVTVADDFSSAAFTLRQEAQWQDGTKVTPEDVIFSFEMLREKGDPTYRVLYANIESVEKTAVNSVVFTFREKGNRELPLIAASMPVFSKAYYTRHDFEKSTLDPPMGSGPYKVEAVDPGRSITYGRTKSYWGEKLPFNRGQNNFAQIRYDMYRDENVALEAFKSGAYDFRQELISRNWATAYDCPALRDGRIVKRVIQHAIPQGMQAFQFNLRKAKFADPRVREAIDLALDFPWLNHTIFYDAYQRNTSFFDNTPFAATGIPQGDELKLLEPFRASLPPELFTEAYAEPTTDGSGNARRNLVKAQKLLEEGDWRLKDGVRINAATGEKLTIEFMLRQPTMERVVLPMRRNLEKLGIQVTIRRVDDAQYQKREEGFDFDIVSIWINRGLFFPGNEQVSLWQSAQADIKGSNNLAGLKNANVDAMLGKIASAKTLPELTAAARALDRILLWSHIVIPNWHSNNFRVAYWDRFGMPSTPAKYNLGLQTWWVKK